MTYPSSETSNHGSSISALRRLAVAALMLASGCACAGSVPTPDAATCDGSCDAGALDASHPDGGLDGGPRDAGQRDAGRHVVDLDAAVGAALDMICDAPAYGRCTAPWHCRCDSHGEIAGPPPPDVDDCVVGARTSCELALEGALRSGFRDGWTIDIDAAELCMRQRRRLFDECMPPAGNDDLPMACRDALITNVGFGEPCPPGVRCADGAGLCIEGVCRSLPDTEGASCRTICALGLACVAGRCSAPVGPGGECDSLDDCAGTELCMGGLCGRLATEGEACDAAARCASGLICRDGACAPEPAQCERGGTGECGATAFCGIFPPSYCAARRGVGDACALDEECRTDLTCVGDESGATCVKLPALGERCTGRCDDGLRCFVDLPTGVATCQPPIAAGSPCGRTTVGSSPCEDGLACVAGTCGPPPVEGEPCADDRSCAPGLTCSLRDGSWVCVPLADEGSECGPQLGCRTGLWCDTAGICRRPALEGQPCGECDTGLDCRYDESRGRSVCMSVPTAVGDECGGVCAGELYCDTLAGSCIPSVCLTWFESRY